MKVADLLNSIPEEKLSFIASKTKVDFQVKKLTGVMMFKLILMSMFETPRTSLRVMESVLESAKFKMLLDEDCAISSRYNSIRDRICTMNYVFFEEIFNYVFNKYNKDLGEANFPTKVDSTYISIPAKLLDWGMINGGNGKSNSVRQLKYSVSMQGSIPSSVEIYTEQSFVSEDKALEDAILKNIHSKSSIMVVDRGLASRKAMTNINEKGLMFLVRSKKVKQFKETKNIQLFTSNKPKKSTITIISDKVGKLKSQNNKWTSQDFRLITATINKTQEEISWITNVLDVSAYDLADIYKKRWDIEVFFKFLKQHLNLNHLVSRTINGMKVMLYMTLILAILIIVYKKKNKIETYKIAKLKFEIELDNELIKLIVQTCGGDPNKAHYLWNSS